jgi:hypothetical protein
MRMTYVIPGLVLLFLFAFMGQIAARIHNDSIPPHRKPPIAFSRPGMWIFNLVWLVVLTSTIWLLALGSGWWTLAFFPGGLLIFGILVGILRR